MSAKYSESYKRIGQVIREYRKEKGWTQEELAEKTSISISYLTKIEAPNCDKAFSLEVLFDISDALGINVCDLLKEL